MAIVLARVHCPSVDAALDGFTNDFVFESTAGAGNDLTAIFSALSSFYNSAGTGTGTNALSTYMSPSLDSGSGHTTVTVYDIAAHLAGTPFGAPIGIGAIHVGVSTSTGPMPEGVAAALSFRTDYTSDVEFQRDPTTHKVIGRPRARDRGRIYVGPLAANAMVQDTTSKRTKLTDAFITDLLAAAFDLSSTHTSGSDSWAWRQWSRKKAAVGVVTELWSDDRPDYQRRRTDATPGTRTFRDASSA